MSAVLESTGASAPAPRRHTEHHFVTHDGQQLFYRYWPATSGVARGAIVLFHRGHEHGGRMAHLVDELDLPDMAFFAWDARGHGQSPGPRGYSPSFATSVRDIQTFMAHLQAEHGVAQSDVHVVAQSVGAVLVSAWVHDYAPRLRGLTLASPAFKVKLYVPFARAGIRLWQSLVGPFYVNSYVKAKFLTHDAERIASYEADPLIARPIASHILLGLYEAAERVVADAAAITVPTQLLISGADWVVHQGPQRAFFQRLGSAVKEVHELPGFFHDTLGEKDRHVAVARIRDFVNKRFAVRAPAPVDLRMPHRQGATFDEAQALARPLSPWSLRGLYWASVRTGLRVGGWLSKGIALGHATGFDSGSTLDYVYRNQAAGMGPIGRLVDRVYLDSIGWRGIRVRKQHVQELLNHAMARVRDQGMPVRLMDIAAGHGRYVLDAVADSAVKPEAILLRDYSDINVQDGTALIQARGLQQVARFVKADAFDRASLRSVQPAPTVAVVSGLYELFADNQMVSESLAGIADAMPEGGCLVYTGQPWHPQLEMIARALTSHRQGQAWVMRRRTQQEMDQLVEAAGFRKVSQRVDEWGIFTVSLAVRVRSA
ncbi:bifunctional alpha/beta hydrolase/class I SAM-dependent methyltransferase [Aquabacterium sp. NJ1]|uniref:bifunctional alpha/beta hydrolase/class I SAM-dependent methyltransferase n=1 Tax=Aquabacterium sp. NJ1 TaxID=1538295 RepID=UPI0006920E05|nr:bifunctional alpha/beta hydrolase/class I SAM-dependent methyltransferase [Aquabacterium sp. NJ1]